jgi:hypothetical protein
MLYYNNFLLILILSAALLFRCSGLPDNVKDGKNDGVIIVVKEEAARREGPLYILPQENYAILKNIDESRPSLVSAAAPLIIKENEINAPTVRYCLDKLDDYYPMRKIIAVCNYSNRLVIDSVISNMENPARVEFREAPGDGIEFYLFK